MVDANESILSVVLQHKTLEDVMRFVVASRAALPDVIVQDEYTHDVVVRLNDQCWVVYDTT